MKNWSRRDVLKSGAVLPAAAASGISASGQRAAAAQSQPASGTPPLRERSLLDFGWRFHFGHANDAGKDFGFGSGRSGGFQKTGGFLAPSNLAFG